MPADPLRISRRNRTSSNRVPNSSKKSGGSKRNNAKTNNAGKARELLFAEDGQQYAKVLKRLGDGRFEVQCLSDGQVRLAHVRGKLWKRVWVVPSDLVLLGLRTFQDQKADIIHKYATEEERTLASMGEIPGGLDSHEMDPHYQDVWTRSVDGACRAGFLPDDEVFGFDADA